MKAYRSPWAFLIMLLVPAAAPAGELYFIIIYGAQRPVINQPRYTHTWAVFVKLSGQGCDPRTYRAESFAISWMPATLQVQPQKLHREPGVNLTHEQTVAWCYDNRTQISQFGPYQIRPRLWEMAARRFAQLANGEIMYRASDLLNGPGRGPEVCNCIYAVMDIDGRDRSLRFVTLGFGQRGSAFVARELAPLMINKHQTHPWVNERLGIEQYPTIRRGLGGLLAP